MTRTEDVGVLCVEDNPHVAEALRIKLSAEPGYVWKGWRRDASGLVKAVETLGPSVVLLDLDMPGPNAFDALAELSRSCEQCRTVIVSGHVRRDYIERALQAGAWGYASKNDDEEEILRVIGLVAHGEIAFSPEVGQVFNQPG